LESRLGNMLMLIKLGGFGEMSLYDIKEVDGRRQIVWNRGRLRGLEETKERIEDIVPHIKKLLKKKRKIKVLEVGCGYGKALLELRKIFGERVEIHGINSEERWTVKLVRRFGLAEKIFNKDEIDRNLPKIHILDAGRRIPFKGKSFDFIFSQACVQYIEDKALFLEEVNRILTDEGLAIIELQEMKEDYPVEYGTLFEIWDGEKKINCINYLKKFKNLKVRNSKLAKSLITSARRNWHYAILKRAKRFNLGLRLIHSFDLNKIHGRWFGSKAIYGGLK
jgi:ubiquinone/menaquinone biosynthesis C-methylase UbiE